LAKRVNGSSREFGISKNILPFQLQYPKCKKPERGITLIRDFFCSVVQWQCCLFEQLIYWGKISGPKIHIKTNRNPFPALLLDLPNVFLKFDSAAALFKSSPSPEICQLAFVYLLIDSHLVTKNVILDKV